MKNLIILHEYGAPDHYTGLSYLVDNYYSGKVKIVYREFTIIRKIISSVRHLNCNLFLKQLKNILTLIGLILTKNKIIILGIAPFDYRIVLINFIIKNHVVFYHTSWPYWDNSFYPKKYLSKTNMVRVAWKNFLEKHIKGVFAVTNVAAINLANNYCISSKIEVVSHAVDNSVFFTRSEQYNSDKLKVLYVGRFVEDKGIYIIEDLILKLPKDKYEYTFVGDGKLKSYILGLTSNYSNVRCLGFIRDSYLLSREIRSQDVLLLPSLKTENWEEVFGKVIIEAMACGVVVVTTDHVGPSEIIENGVNGFVFKENEYLDKTEILLKAMLEDRGKLLNIKSKSNIRSQMYSLENISCKWNVILSKYI